MFLNGQGKECEVFDYYSEYKLQGSCQQCLTFFGSGQQFGPDGPDNTFKQGGEYTLLSLVGNELSIDAGGYPNPQWIPVG
jgi:hypothetical protein